MLKYLCEEGELRFGCLAGSERNALKLTHDGVDVMGERLADEVRFYHCFLVHIALMLAS